MAAARRAELDIPRRAAAALGRSAVKAAESGYYLNRDGQQVNWNRAVIQACLRPGLPLTTCTIYNGTFPDPAYQRLVTTALALFNDAILRVAIDHRLPVIDLRAICASPEDYANPIEPSSVGGAKIARTIAALATHSAPSDRATRIMAGA